MSESLFSTSESLLSALQMQAQVQRNILLDLALRSHSMKDRADLLLRAQCLDDLVTVLKSTKTDAATK